MFIHVCEVDLKCATRRRVCEARGTKQGVPSSPSLFLVLDGMSNGLVVNEASLNRVTVFTWWIYNRP